MPSYNVFVIREFYTEVPVEAPTTEDAKIRAVALLQDKPSQDFAWVDAQGDDHVLLVRVAHISPVKEPAP
jgi:hypothetical protein